MKLGKVVVYFLVFALLGSYVYFGEIRRKADKEAGEKQAAKLVDFTKDQIEEIELDSKKHGKITLKKMSGNWLVTAPIKTKADARALDGLLASAAESAREKIVAEKDVNWPEYGLDKPQFSIAIRAPQKEAKLFFGEKNPSGSSYYLRVGDRPELLMVQDTLQNSLDKSVFDLRDKTIVAIANDDVARVVFSTAGKDTEFKREGPGAWVMERPERMKVKASVIERDIGSLTNLNAVEIIDSPEKEGDKYGFEKPESTIVLAGEKLEQVLVVGKPAGDPPKEGEPSPNRYAMIKGRDMAYVISNRGITGLTFDPEKLRDKSVFAFEPGNVEKVEVTLDGKKWAASRGKDNKWDITEPEKKSNVPAWSVTSVLWTLKDLEWTSVNKNAAADPTAHGLDKPRLVVNLKVDGAKEPVVFNCAWQDPQPSKPEAAGTSGAEGKAETKTGPSAPPQANGPQSTPASGDPATAYAVVRSSGESKDVLVLSGKFIKRFKDDLDRMVKDEMK
ncbi:MAG: DUF4340 domain-containing protein [Pseudomonadota bacterium]